MRNTILRFFRPLQAFFTRHLEPTVDHWAHFAVAHHPHLHKPHLHLSVLQQAFVSAALLGALLGHPRSVFAETFRCLWSMIDASRSVNAQTFLVNIRSENQESYPMLMAAGNELLVGQAAVDRVQQGVAGPSLRLRLGWYEACDWRGSHPGPRLVLSASKFHGDRPDPSRSVEVQSRSGDFLGMNFSDDHMPFMLECERVQ